MANNIQEGEYSSDNRGNYLKLLKKEPVYGPITSRRLGLSLGVNPIQGGFACNWSCVYCQYGIDDLDSQVNGSKKIRFTELGEIDAALRKRLGSNEHFDSITICGPTEPTMHPRFNELAGLVVSRRNEYRPRTPVTLFTNAHKLDGLNLYSLDWVFMKLDAGNEETFQRFNRPKTGTLAEVVENIKGANVRKKVVQSMFVGGRDGNLNEKNVGDYLGLLRDVGPDEVHLYSLLYAPLPNSDIRPVDGSTLDALAERVRDGAGCDALVFNNPVQEGELFRF